MEEMGLRFGVLTVRQNCSYRKQTIITRYQSHTRALKKAISALNSGTSKVAIPHNPAAWLVTISAGGIEQGATINALVDRIGSRWFDIATRGGILTAVVFKRVIALSLNCRRIVRRVDRWTIEG